MAYREDIVTLRPPKRLADGRLRVDGWFARTGVLEYIEPGGKVRREYRPPDEVFHQDSLSAYEGLIVTDEHPSEMITLHNASQFRKGQVGESVRRDGTHVAGAIFVDDPGLIGAMERNRNPKRQLSVGYHIEIDPTPGVTPDGERYDVIQRKIRPNHVAVVERGRAGTAHVRMDSASSTRPFAVAFQKGPSPMPAENKTENPGATAALADALAKNAKLTADLATANSRADAAEGRVAGLEQTIAELRSQRTDSDQIAKLEIERDQEKARADAAEAALAGAGTAIAAGVARRVKIQEGAVVVLGPKGDDGKPRRFDDMTDRQIMETVISTASGANVSEKSDEYVSARFDACVENFAAGAAALQRVTTATQLEQKKAQQAAAGRVTAREDVIKKKTEAWRRPLPSQRASG